MAEAAGLTILILFLFAIMSDFFDRISIDGQVILFLSPFLMIMYVFFCYIFSGMEYTELFHEKDFKKEHRRVLTRSLIAGIVFVVTLLIVKGIPNNMSEIADTIMMPLLFIVFYYIIGMISLKRSLRKNIDLYK